MSRSATDPRRHPRRPLLALGDPEHLTRTARVADQAARDAVAAWRRYEAEASPAPPPPGAT